jgi:hypothetical protein
LEKQKTHNVLLSVFRGLIKDAELLLGLNEDILLCDYEKVALSLKSRGLGVFLLDFPSICSGLESSLEIGDWSPLLGLPFIKNGRPTIFVTIFSKIFNEDGIVLDEACIESIRVLRQLLKFAKKFRIDAPKAAVMEKYHEFAEIEEQIHSPVLSWGRDDLHCERGYPSLVNVGLRHPRISGDLTQGTFGVDATSDLWVLDCIQTLADRFASRFKYSDEWFSPKHGPGAVSEKFVDSKFEFPTWPFRLESKFPFDLYGLVSHQIWDGQFPIDHSVPAKLIGVPKDFKGPRLIASEPIASQYIQQGLMRVIRKNVSTSQLRHCIDFRSQEPSRDLALSASETRDLSTIDLSSASDRLSCAVVECIFRKNFSFLEMLNAARTPDIQYPDGRVQRMKKFAAQGAAFTFPIQSIVYALICMGVIYAHTGESRLSVLAKKVRVYGDDMIVPTDYFHVICRTLENLQLKVNLKKSFTRSSFRESCGMDAYKGRDITPANVLSYFSSHDPNSLVSTVECANNLYLKGFFHASRNLLETIPAKFQKNLAYKDSVSTAFGILAPVSNPALRNRWSEKLHRYETKILTVESKVSKSSPGGHDHLHQWFVENPSPDKVWEAGEVTRVKARYCLRWVASHLVRLVD